MPIDGSGNFTRSYNWVSDKAGGIKVVASRMDGEFDNYANALNQAFWRNGIVGMTGTLNMGNNAIAAVNDGTALTPGIRFNSDGTSGVFLPGVGRVALTAAGAARLEANATGVVIGGSLSASGNATVSGTLGVTGATTLGNATVSGTLGVTGATTLGSASVSGTLGVTGTTTLNGLILLGNNGFRFASDGAQDTGMRWAADGDMRTVVNGADVITYTNTVITVNPTLAVNGVLSVLDEVYTGPHISTGSGVTTADSGIEVGGQRTGSGISYVDFHSTPSTDFEARLIRQAGVNGAMSFANTGSGGLAIDAGAGTLSFQTSSVTRASVSSGGLSIPNSLGVLFRNPSNTASTQFIHQNDDNFVAYNAAGTPVLNFTAGASPSVAVGAANNRISLDNATNVITVVQGGAERARFQSGNFGIGTTNPDRPLHVNATDNWLKQQNASRSWLSGMGTSANYRIYDETGAIERLSIDTNGAIGLSVAPVSGFRLSVSGNVLALPPAGWSAGQTASMFVGDGNNGIQAVNGGATILNGANSLVFAILGNNRFQIGSSGDITSTDRADAVGFKGTPVIATSSDFNVSAAHVGRTIYCTGAGGNVTINTNAAVGIVIGHVNTIINDTGGARTITPSAGVTLKLAGSGATGTRTLANGGVCTLIKVATDTWFISGAGVS